MISRFIITVEHDSTCNPAEIEEVLEAITCPTLEAYLDMTSGDVLSVTVEPQNN